MELCPYCGTQLKKTNYENLFCPNCGKITFKEQEESSDENRKPSYVG